MRFPHFRNWLKFKDIGRQSVDKRYALVQACLIGILSGFAALLLKQGIGFVGTLRIHLAENFSAPLVLPLAGLILGTLAGWLIENLAPSAAGGGVPQVKAVLAGFPVACSLRVAIVKAMGTILILGAGFTLGRRGPTVHIGAALASQLAAWLPTSPENRRQIIAAGAAAGLAASFNTPIAAVLFVAEELMRDVSDFTLEIAIFASFTGAVVSRLLGTADLNISLAMNDPNTSFSAVEIPLYLLLGIVAGVLGAFFNHIILFFVRLNKRVKLPMSLRFGVTGLISGGIIACLPPFFRDNAGLRDILINGDQGWQAIAIAFVVHFFLTPLAYGSGAPGGLFAPGLVLGSALGYLMGVADVSLFGIGSEHTFAFAGMAAFFTAVVRVPMTAIVIVFEMTTDFNLVLPLMIGAGIAYIVAESIFPGSIYQHLLEANGMKIEDEPINNHFLNQLEAYQVMQPQVESLDSNMTLDDVVLAMSKSHHRGFPVVAQGKLVGIITQSDLVKYTKTNDLILLSQIMTPRPITVNPHTSLSDVLYLLNHYQLSRLPVTEDNRLIGIITRTDIIRAEVNEINGSTQVAASHPSSYVIYQTRAPATGKGRILIILANPKTASALVQIAAAIASQYDYELECLQVIKLPKHSSPMQTPVNSLEIRHLMRRMEKLARNWRISVHTQIRLAHDIDTAILETITERHIDMMVMGWKGKTTRQGAIFSNLVDSLIDKVPCDLILIKLGTLANAYPKGLDQNANWLIASSFGPNTQRAMQLLPGLSSLYRQSNTLKLWLCQVDIPSLWNKSKTDNNHLKKVTQTLQDELNISVIPLPLCSYSVSDALISVNKMLKSQLIILGVSRESLLKQTIQGNIPSAIAKSVDSTVILVRAALDK